MKLWAVILISGTTSLVVSVLSHIFIMYVILAK